MGLGLGLCCCEDRVVCNTFPQFYFTAIDRGLGPGFHYFNLRMIDSPSFPFPNQEFLLTSVNNTFVFERPQIAIDEAGDGIEIELILGNARFDVTCIDTPPFGSTCLTFHRPVSLVITDPINGTTRFNFVENTAQSDSCSGIYGRWIADSDNCPDRIGLNNNVSARIFRESDVPTFQVTQAGVVGGGTCAARNDTFTLSHGSILVPRITDGWVVDDSWDLLPVNVVSSLPNMGGIHLETTSKSLNSTNSSQCFPDTLSVNDPLVVPFIQPGARMVVSPVTTLFGDFFVILDMGFPNGIQNKLNYFDSDWSDLLVSFIDGVASDCDFSGATWVLTEV